MKVAFEIDKHRWSPSPLPGQVVLVTTLDRSEVPNVAPKSWVSMVAFGPPPILMVGCSMEHATARNALYSGEFVVNIPGVELARRCVDIAGDHPASRIERFHHAGLTPVPSQKVKVPSIAECRAHLECELDGVREFQREVCLFGKIVAATIDDTMLGANEPARYRAMSSFFFLQDHWFAALGPAWNITRAPAGPRQVLTILAVADLARSVAFYRNAFGWPAPVETPVYVEFELPDGQRIGVYERSSFALNVGHAPTTGTEIYLHAEDLTGAIARVEATGAKRLSPLSRRDWGDDAAYYSDPDGNVVVVARPFVSEVRS